MRTSRATILDALAAERDGVNAIEIPDHLVERWRTTPDGVAWLDRLPGIVNEAAERWSLAIGAPFRGQDVTASWVAPVERADGTRAVLKVGVPHLEAEQEIDGLRFWDGDPTVRLLEADGGSNAMLLERCEPGGSLRSRPDDEQDAVVAGLLLRLWRAPPEPHPFRDLAVMIRSWIGETEAEEDRWAEPGIVRQGLDVLRELASERVEDAVLLATDLHAGNVLAAQREPWLVIDPKPFVGDRTYDATQHLMNSYDRLRRDPDGMIRGFADLLGVDAERVRLWTFARTATTSRDDWDEDWIEIARALAG
jgi:streptomycin 6-kinase